MVWLAIIPSIVLFIFIWRKDKIEKEPVGLSLWFIGDQTYNGYY